MPPLRAALIFSSTDYGAFTDLTFTYIEDLELDLLPEGMRKRLPELGSLDFIREGKNIIMTGNPETGKTHTAIGLGIKACEQGYRVLYTTVPYLVTELKESNNQKKLLTY